MAPEHMALGVSIIADQAAASLNELCRTWSDAPAGVHEFLDGLQQTRVFLYS